jgi:hypothetical protein
VTFQNGGADIGGCIAVADGAGAAQCTTSALRPGANSIVGMYSGQLHLRREQLHGARADGSTPGRSSSPPTQRRSPFGGQSMNTTSPSISSTINPGAGGAVAIRVSRPPRDYAVTHKLPAAAMAAAATCNDQRQPSRRPLWAPVVRLNGTVIITYAGGGPTVVMLTGTSERIPRHTLLPLDPAARADAGGKTFWEGEATRVAGSARTSTRPGSRWRRRSTSAPSTPRSTRQHAYVTDLYNTFFNRAPDAGGLDFWVGQLDSGLPREVALAAFMFSTEFGNFTHGDLRQPAARAEVNTVVDFYRGSSRGRPTTAASTSGSGASARRSA